MNNIHILDRDFNLKGIIDEYVSTIWRPSYSDIGDFEIYLGASDKAINLLQKDSYIVRSKDISVKNGITTYKKVMLIKNIQLVTDVENGDFLTVTGKELKYILHQRIVWQQTTLTGTAENAIRRLVNENAIIPADPNRIIPDLILSDEIGLTDSIEKQITGDYLDIAIKDICSTYNIGWDIYISNGQMVFEIYSGLDRSYQQTERPYVRFSEDFENLYNTEYQLNTEEFANTTLIGGEGEGIERIYTTIGNDNSGLDRFETFTDARDISQNKDSEDTIDSATYLLLLQERGLENLTSLGITEGFTGEVQHDGNFKYEKDFFLGDIVTVVNKYGITQNVRVVSAIESEDEAGKILVPQFNM